MTSLKNEFFSEVSAHVMTSRSAILNPESLQSRFEAQFAQDKKSSVFVVEVVDTIASTNAQLLSEAEESDFHYLIALQQTAGMGRRGGVWQSPPAGNLYLSYCFHTAMPMSILALLPLALGVEIAREIESKFGVEVKIKWPNDLYLEGKKCGGMLLETKVLEEGLMAVVVGVGINVASHPSEELLGRPATSLQSVSAEQVILEDVALVVMSAIKSVSGLESNDLFECLEQQWPKRDFLFDRPVTVSQSAGLELRGVAKGIAADGGLKVDCGGRIETVYAGEVSLEHVGH